LKKSEVIIAIENQQGINSNYGSLWGFSIKWHENDFTSTADLVIDRAGVLNDCLRSGFTPGK